MAQRIVVEPLVQWGSSTHFYQTKQTKKPVNIDWLLRSF
ncbi:hypothetical protein N646_2575 [Vibrio alginolyticus NBRC 15630 = ATCC 17749]|uniref:Uncharacterized protein n=1 Tax=Vibrio alginolyticus (strain ATCC 17749 / DSM 2171 / NBRC 15630 / NCIMB 1903 / NCTC 12160 / XII-53) TaxID=1219076 RepID=A0A2I3CED3_VIBAX|nr:hypothetical protein N646_2575 [Vibrio alginolyticus NBRC 15630 = ATCC 17749]